VDLKTALAGDWWLPHLTWRTALLLPLSWMFGLATALRRHLFRTGRLTAHRLSAKVVVVGNLTVGGAGKTPLVIHLAQALAQAGLHPGVVARGYGAPAGVRGAMALEVLPESTASEAGDEPLLIRRRAGCPVFVCRDRAAAARALLAAHPRTDVIIADDGLQHYRLARDYEVAVFDTRGAGNRRLLPAGPLREPLARAASVDAVVANGGDGAGMAAYAMQLETQPLYRLVDPRETCGLADFAARHGPRVTAVAGIGNPQRFFDSMRRAGLTVAERRFDDHHVFRREELAALDAHAIVMTEKDAIKCTAFDDPRIWVVPVSANVDRRLVASILERIRGPKAA
jgi:tetraacyldisaccharide 4'-kinase